MIKNPQNKTIQDEVLELQQQLAKSKRELSTILEGIYEACMSIDQDWKITTVNKNFELLTQKKGEAVLGKTIWEIYPELTDTDGSFWIETQKVMKNAIPSQYVSLSNVLGFWSEVRIYPKDDGIVVFFNDATKIKKTEQELDSSERRFEQLADSIPHIVWTSKACGHLDFYNARLFEYTGMKKTAKIEQSWESIIHPEDYPRTLDLWNNSLQTSKPYNIEYRLRDQKTNTYRWFLGLALPVKDAKGNIVKWFGSCTDIDEQKQLASKIEKQNFDLEDALAARNEFLSIASHELKTPLTSLKLYAQHFQLCVEKKLPHAYAPQTIDRLVLQVDKQANKLNRLVDDMLDVARIRTGALTLRPQKFYLSEAITEVQEILKNQFSHSQSPDPIIENHCPDLLVCWDQIRIEQVLINLFTNAIRYGQGKQITLSIKAVEGKILLALKDQGIGIEAQNLEKIFVRFEKIRTPTEINGLGLGLYISRQIIEAHRGTLVVESEFGVGSVFTIELPA